VVAPLFVQAKIGQAQGLPLQIIVALSFSASWAKVAAQHQCEITAPNSPFAILHYPFTLFSILNYPFAPFSIIFQLWYCSNWPLIAPDQPRSITGQCSPG
jgi:hypothetical protein